MKKFKSDDSLRNHYVHSFTATIVLILALLVAYFTGVEVYFVSVAIVTLACFYTFTIKARVRGREEGIGNVFFDLHNMSEIGVPIKSLVCEVVTEFEYGDMQFVLLTFDFKDQKGGVYSFWMVKHKSDVSFEPDEVGKGPELPYTAITQVGGKLVLARGDSEWFRAEVTLNQRFNS